MSDWTENEEERASYLALALVPGIGPVRLSELLQRFSTPGRVLAATPSELKGLSRGIADAASALRSADRGAGSRILRELKGLGAGVLLPAEQRFPAALREIAEPPLCLFYQGNLELLKRPAVAIVGSRDHSEYGGAVCRALARSAAASGLVVVSGMARGLDAVAHAGALEAGPGPGATIGVLGNGLGVVYPAANRALYQDVADRGLLLTEFPPGERPRAGGFPRRNRLISALARVTVVVEAAFGSGALQTAGLARDQGREVMMVPGPITSVVSQGTNDWIRDGAAPLLDLADLLLHYPELKAPGAAGPGAADRHRGPLERRILNALQIESLPTERLVDATDAPVEQALEALSLLELDGRIQLDSAGRYRLTAAGLFD